MAARMREIVLSSLARVSLRPEVRIGYSKHQMMIAMIAVEAKGFAGFVLLMR
jgi:hypothetical protein